MTAGIKLTMQRDHDPACLKPYGEAAWNDFERVPVKPKLLTVTIYQPRNPEHLALYWVLCQRAADNDAEFSDAESVDQWIKVKLRMVKEYLLWDGRLAIRTDSISAEHMDQIQFNHFFKRAEWLISERLGCTTEELLKGPHA